jgi:cell division protein FtsN
MRIDYSSPKQSYVSGQNKPKARKEASGLLKPTIVITAIICLIIGYGAGWYLSQRSAKKAFQAANEQKSLESSPKQSVSAQPTVQPLQPTKPPVTDANQPQNSQSPQGAANVPNPALSFYKTLPGDHKNNVIGSGVNTTDDKIKPHQPVNPLVSPAAKSTTSEKPVAKVPEVSGFAVQVASFSLKSEAEAIKNKLVGKGYNVSIVESNLGEKGIWYRVKVGRKLDPVAAKELAGKLGKGAMVIPD